jgi:hypothetical protein
MDQFEMPVVVPNWGVIFDFRRAGDPASRCQPAAQWPTRRLLAFADGGMPTGRGVEMPGIGHFTAWAGSHPRRPHLANYPCQPHAAFAAREPPD